MRLPEVGKLLTVISLYDNRTIDDKTAAAEAWFALPWLQRTNYDLALEAVVMFFSQPPNERGELPYLDPRWLRYWVIQAARVRETEEARERARHAVIEAPTNVYAPPVGFREQLANLTKRVPE